VRVTHQGTRGFGGYIVERIDPRGGTYYWIGYQPQESEIDEASDIAAVRSGHISVTPLHLDLTHEGMRRKLGAQFEAAPSKAD
jgi:5'-nucleotidase